MKNLEIAKLFRMIADMLELQNIPWKPQAYRTAAQSIESLSEDIGEIAQRGELQKIPGVGEHIAAKMDEFLKTGKLDYYEKLKKKVKIDLEPLLSIPQLGPRKIKLLYQKLRIKNVRDLENALKSGKVRKLQGFGEKTERTLLEGIDIVKNRPHRFLYTHAQAVVEKITKALQKSAAVHRVEIAGSFRRGKETVGDLDFIVVSSKPEAVMELFTSLPDVKKVIARGTTKSSVLVDYNLQVDLRVVTEKEFGSALLYFIGNKEHNIELRKIALKKGYTLSEYGLFTLKGKKWVAGRTERDVYAKLGLPYIEPELRENMGEIAAAAQRKLPSLMTLKDVSGMFHNHSNWTDGNNTLLEMAQKAEALKWKFISFNDHYGPIGVTNPLTEKRLTNYVKEIEKVQKKVSLRVFSGVEIDILKDGTLPLSPSRLKQLDVVVASVHLGGKMPEQEMTSRVVKAIENYPVNILGHPTSRLLNEREPIKINLEKVFAAAKANNVFMEINGSPSRMDLAGEQVKAMLDAGCKGAISTDAHDQNHLPYHYLGVLSARRGWAEKKNILNCWSLPKIEKALQK